MVRIGSFAGVLATCLLAAGCSSASSGGASSAAVPQSGNAGQASARGELSSQEADFLAQAEEELVSRCMQSRGEHYVPVRLPSVKDSQIRPEGAVYGSDDVAWAQRYGFGIHQGPPNPADDIARNNANQRYFEGLQPQQRQVWTSALTGTQQGLVEVTLDSGRIVSTRRDGCVGQVRLGLYGDLKQYLRDKYSTQEIDKIVQRAVLADPAYDAVADKWSACMTERGYRYSNPAAAWHAMEGRVTAAEEVRVATASAKCARSVGLRAAAAGLEKKQRALEESKREGEVLAWQELRQRAVAAARARLGLGS